MLMVLGSQEVYVVLALKIKGPNANANAVHTGQAMSTGGNNEGRIIAQGLLSPSGCAMGADMMLLHFFVIFK